MKSEPKQRRTFTARLEPSSFEWLRLKAFQNYRSLNAELNQIIWGLIEIEKAAGASLATDPAASDAE